MSRAALSIIGIVIVAIGLALFGFRHISYQIPEDWRPAVSQRSAAAAGPPVSITYLGISGYQIKDPQTTILLDPTFTRPTAADLISGPLVSDPSTFLLDEMELAQTDFILVNHTHHDHALDVPAIALQTGAVVIGSASTVQLAQSRGVPATQTHEVSAGDVLTLGSFQVKVASGRHSPLPGLLDTMSGVIPADAGPLWFWEYRQDVVLSYRLESTQDQRSTSIWFHPSSSYQPGDFLNEPADTLIFGITGQVITEQDWAGVLAEAQPVRVLPTHYDNFFRPLSDGMGLLPMVDLDAHHASLQAAAAQTPAAERWVVLEHLGTLHL